MMSRRPLIARGLQDADALDMRQAVMALPTDLRRVVALRFYAGMDSTQIGAILELPAATVRTRLRRALELLRRDLGACEIDHPSIPRGEGIPMANQLPDAETARDLEALPADLQPLYQRLTDDGAAWQAASADRFALLARTLVADVERIASDGAIDAQADDTPQATLHRIARWRTYQLCPLIATNASGFSERSPPWPSSRCWRWCYRERSRAGINWADQLP